MLATRSFSVYDPSILAGATIAGFFTWLILNRHTVRGDHATWFYMATFVMSFFTAKQSGKTLETPLIFCVTLASVYGASALLCTVAYRYSPSHPLAGYPGPRSWWFSSLKLSYVTFKGRRHLVLDALHAKYGPFVRIGPNILSINSPTANVIYSTNHSMEKAESYATPGHLDAVALFFKQNAKDHNDRKRIWSRAFTSAGVADFFPPLERRTWQLLKCIQNRGGKDGVVNLSQCIGHWSYDFMGEMVFGGSNGLEFMRDGDPEDMIEGGKKATIILDSFGQTPWLMDIVWHLPAGKDMHRLKDIAAEMMRRRIKADGDVEMRDLASYLLAGDPETGAKIPLQDLEIDAVVAVQGGSDNTAMTMSLAFYFLLAKPTYYQTLQAELDKAFPSDGQSLGGGDLDPDALVRLPFLNGVINESLRLGTPFFLPRIVPAAGATIDGRFIPGGTIIGVAAYSQQVSPENFWPSPLEFCPERWYPEGLGPGSKTERGALASFSSGPHVCVAKSFAYHEMRHVIARLVLTFDMAFPEGFDVPGFRDGILNMRTLILEKPLMVKVTARKLGGKN